MRIGLSSIVGDGFGNGSFVFGEVPSGASFPAAGTILETLTLQTYPIAEGGGQVNTDIGPFPNQDASVYRKADGSGGDYLDWDNAFDIAYKPSPVIFYVSSEWSDNEDGPSVTINGSNYWSQRRKLDYRHDGYGSYYTGYSNTGYKPYGTFVVEAPSQTEVPSGTSNFYNNGINLSYYYNGTGSTYTTSTGYYYSNGELIFENVTSTGIVSLPSGSTPVGTYYGNRYTWNGSGGYNEQTTWYVPYGTFIENYNGYNYFHDGNGSYYSYME